jgi:hypothetical protein
VWAIDGDLDWARSQHQGNHATSKALAVRSLDKLCKLLRKAIEQAVDAGDGDRKRQLSTELEELETPASAGPGDVRVPVEHGGKRLRGRASRGVGAGILAPPVQFLRRSAKARAETRDEDAASTDGDFEERSADVD